MESLKDYSGITIEIRPNQVDLRIGKMNPFKVQGMCCLDNLLELSFIGTDEEIDPKTWPGPGERYDTSHFALQFNKDGRLTYMDIPNAGGLPILGIFEALGSWTDLTEEEIEVSSESLFDYESMGWANFILGEDRKH